MMKELGISLKQLSYYLITAKHESLRQASRELGITQPSLSAQLKSLEDALGVVLFERNRGGVLLTPLGRELLLQAHEAVAAAEALVEAARFAMRGPGGTYRFGVSPSVGPYILPWLLPAVHQDFPDVKFYVSEEPPRQLAEGLEQGRYDLVLTTLPLEAPALTVMPLFREPIYLVINADHPLAGEDCLEAGQLADLEILSVQEQFLFHRQVHDLCRRFSARLLRDYEGTSLDAIRQMVYMDIGSAFLPALYIRSEITDRHRLKVMPIKGETIDRVHALAWRNNSPLRGFYRSLGAYFVQLIDQEFGGEVTTLRSMP